MVGKRDALQSWLQEAMGAFLAGPARAGEECVVAVGNDAGDLDSVVSAIALSYWLDTPGLRYPALETIRGQIDGFFSQLPYKCNQNPVASVGD